MDEKILDISWGTIIKLGLAGVAFYILYLIRNILVWLLFAAILAMLFDPAILFLQKRRIPRPLAAAFLYMLVFGFIGFSVYMTVPLLISELYQFSKFFPQYFEKIAPPLQGLGIEAFKDFETFLTTIGESLQNRSSNIISALFSIFGGLGSTLFIITIAIFISAEEKILERGLMLLFPKKYEAYAISLWDRTRQKVSGWFAIKLLGSLLVGGASFIAFTLFDIKYPFSLALLAGALNFIPIVGPLIAGLVIFFLTAIDSLWKALFVVIFFAILQQIEGNILTPILSEKFIKLPPVLVLVALSIGWTLFGLWGAILFVPLFGIIFEFLRDFLKEKKNSQTTII